MAISRFLDCRYPGEVKRALGDLESPDSFSTQITFRPRFHRRCCHDVEQPDAAQLALDVCEPQYLVSYTELPIRMGWFLVQTKGPRNADIDPDQLAQIHAAFADAGIPEAAIIDPIKSIIQTDKWSRQVGDQEVVFDDIVLH